MSALSFTMSGASQELVTAAELRLQIQIAGPAWQVTAPSTTSSMTDRFDLMVKTLLVLLRYSGSALA